MKKKKKTVIKPPSEPTKKPKTTIARHPCIQSVFVLIFASAVTHHGFVRSSFSQHEISEDHIAHDSKGSGNIVKGYLQIII